MQKELATLLPPNFRKLQNTSSINSAEKKLTKGKLLKSSKLLSRTRQRVVMDLNIFDPTIDFYPWRF